MRHKEEILYVESDEVLLSVFHIMIPCSVLEVEEIMFQFHGLPIFQVHGSQKRRKMYPRGFYTVLFLFSVHQER